MTLCMPVSGFKVVIDVIFEAGVRNSLNNRSLILCLFGMFRDAISVTWRALVLLG